MERVSINPWIAPGESISGFYLNSDGLPSIVNSYFKSFWVLGFEEEPLTVKADSFENSTRSFPNSFVKRKTLDPFAPPNPFIPESFADTLLNYVNQSLNLGWINNSTIANKYTLYLTNAKQKLIQGNNSLAIKALDSVLTDVDIDSSTSLSSEAYALIKYNTEYLKEQLEQSDVPTLLIR